MRWLMDENTEMVIIGTYPGEASLKAGHYYMDPRNQFWTIMTKILRDEYKVLKEDQDLKRMEPEIREALLLKYGIGLGDALSNCDRKRSLDKNIVARNHVDKKKMLKKHPNVIFIPNGWKAYKWFVLEPEDEFIDKILPPAPSTSGSNTHDTLDEKTRGWKSRLDLHLGRKGKNL